MQHHVYSAFGKLLKVEDGNGADITDAPVLDPYFTFTGREWDKETQLYYFRARYYDGNVGRFLQQDPEPGKVESPITVTNKYIYAGNNPINRTDPTGRSFWGKLLTGIALVGIAALTGGGGAILLGAAIGAGTSAITGGNILDGALIGGILGAAGVVGNIAGAAAGGGGLGALAGAAAGAIVGGIAGYNAQGSSAIDKAKRAPAGQTIEADVSAPTWQDTAARIFKCTLGSSLFVGGGLGLGYLTVGVIAGPFGIIAGAGFAIYGGVRAAMFAYECY